MRKLAIFATFVFALVFLQEMFAATLAHARHKLWHCCTPGMCDGTCWCCGQTIYCTCQAVPDDEDFGLHRHTDEITFDITGQGETRAFHIVMSNIDERLQALIKKKQASIKAPRRLLGGAETHLKLWCPGIDNDMHEFKTSAVQLAKDEH